MKDRKFRQRYQEYLSTLEGKNFFCYNNRKRGFDFIRNEVVPNLPRGVEPIFLNGKNIESEKYEVQFLSRAFYDFKNYVGFPHLMKIRKGEAIDVSVRAEFVDYLNNTNRKEDFTGKMKYFFDLKEKDPTSEPKEP